jgi:protein SCO1/2
MKTSFVSLVAAFAAVLSASAASPAKPVPSPCCAVTEPAVAACCVEEKNVTPLSTRSLYQLDAKWTNDESATVRLASLRGKPVVLAMVFTHCEYACPILVEDIKRMRAALPEAVRAKAQIVLVSFDTERDTPAALKAFRERSTLDANWTLLRGDAADVQELAMLLGVKFKRDARGQFAHSNLFTILNPAGEIVHQHVGLNGDISEAARALAVVAK